MTERLAVRYRSVTGTPLISVTQVLTVCGRIDSTWFTKEAAVRGSAVHAATERYDRGEGVELPDEWLGYLDAYARFLKAVKPVYAGTEVAVVSTALRLGGRMDRICADLFGHPAILDFKTSAPAPWHGAQLAAYNALRPTGARWACYLGKDGRYALRAYDDPMDHRQFMCDLATACGTVTEAGDYWHLH